MPQELLYARFGKWDEALELVTRELGLGLSVAHSSSNQHNEHTLLLDSFALSTAPSYIRCIQLYATVLALANLGHVSAAKALAGELRRVVLGVKDGAMPASSVFYSYHREMARLMNATAHARIAVAEDDLDLAVALLSPAMELQDSFHYGEPEHFYLPMRQCLGAVLSKQAVLHGHDPALLEAAREMYQADLSAHPNNVWSLQGLAKGGGSGEQQEYGARLFSQYWRGSRTHPIRGSCCEVGIC